MSRVHHIHLQPLTCNFIKIKCKRFASLGQLVLTNLALQTAHLQDPELTFLMFTETPETLNERKSSRYSQDKTYLFSIWREQPRKSHLNERGTCIVFFFEGKTLVLYHAVYLQCRWWHTANNKYFPVAISVDQGCFCALLQIHRISQHCLYDYNVHRPSQPILPQQ